MQHTEAAKKTCYVLLVLFTVVGCIVAGLATTRFALGTPDSSVNGSESPKVMRAKRFELVNEGGKIRAALVQLDDHVGLLLFDADQKPKTLLELGANAMQFKLIDPDIEKPEKIVKSLSQFWQFSYGAVPDEEKHSKTAR